MTFLAGQKVRASAVNALIPLFGRVANDQTKTSNTTLAAVTGLSVPLEASSRYALDGYLAYSAGATGDLKVAFAAPTDSTGHWTIYGQDTASTGGSGSIVAKRATSFGTGTTQTAAGDDSTGQMSCLPRGYIATSTTAGDLTLYFAQNTSNATSTVIRVGSWLRLVKLP